MILTYDNQRHPPINNLTLPRDASNRQTKRLSHLPEILPSLRRLPQLLPGAGHSLAGRIMASLRDNARNPVDEHPIHHSILHEFLQLPNVIPPRNIVGLHRIDPSKEAGNPLDFGILSFFGADHVGGGAEVEVGVACWTTFLVGAGAEEVVEFAVLADTSGLDRAAAPPAATADRE